MANYIHFQCFPSTDLRHYPELWLKSGLTIPSKFLVCFQNYPLMIPLPPSLGAENCSQ